MKRLIVVLTLFCAAAARASITATILDEDGKPLPGARVRAFLREDSNALRSRLLSKDPEPKPIATATSGPDGSVSIDAKGAPVVRLVADATGRAVQLLDVSDGENAGALVLSKDGPQTGRVTSGGKPVANALVAVGGWYTTHTDAEGRYEVPAIAVSSERVTIIHPDFAIHDAWTGSVEGARRREPLDVSLGKGMAISGHVLSADGKTPVAHVRLSVAGWPLAESDDAGAYTIAHAPQGWRAVHATAPQLAGDATNRRASAVDIRLAPAATVSGTVKSARGPVAGAMITLSSDLDPSAAATTLSDAKGRFSFDGAVAGRYNLNGAHPSFTIARSPLVLPATGERVLTAEELIALHGQVVDEAKKPVAGARITVNLMTSNGNPWRARAVASSPAGQFTVHVSRGGSVQFVAVHRGFAAGSLGPLTLEKAREVTITLPAGFPITFHIVDGQRQPVAHATVDMLRTGDGERRANLPCTDTRDECHVTKADGNVDERLVEGKYDLFVGGDDFVPKRLSGQTLTARSSPVTITVDRGVEVSGRVTGSDGSPVAGAIVTARGASSHSTTAGEDGSFSLKGLGAGTLSLTASTTNVTPTMTSPPVGVTAPAKNVVLRIPAPATLSGRVSEKSSGQPITDFQIMAMTGDFGAARPSSAPTPFHSGDGTFTLTAVPGRTELQVTATGYVRAKLSGLSVEEGKAMTGLDVQMERGGRIVGRVTSAGEPVAQASVIFGDRMSSLGGGVTDANGDFVLDGVAAGERTLQVRKQGLLPKEKTVTAKVGEEVRADLELDKGREVGGRVMDRGGRPVDAVRVQVRGVEDRSMRGSAVSDADGNFKITGLGEGHLALEAMHEGYVTTTLDDVDPVQNLVITLEKGGSLSGRVVGLSDADTGAVSVTASYGSSSAHASVDSDGSFTVRGIPDGQVTLSALKSGAQSRRSSLKQVTVSGGSGPFVEIDFSEGISVRGRVTRQGAPATGGSISFSGMKGETGGAAPLGPDGSYQVGCLQSGEYRILVALYGINAASFSEKLTVTGPTTHDIDLNGTSLRGRVVDASTNAPLSDVAIQLRPLASDSVGIRQASTDSDGRFIFDLLQEGAYRLTTQRQQYAPQQTDVTIPGADLDLRLEGAVPTVVHVVDSVTGAPLTADVSVTEDVHKTTVAWNRGGSDGTVKVWLAAGHYSVHVNAAGYTSANLDVVVPTADLNVSLQRGGTITFHIQGANATYRVRLLVNGAATRTDWINSTYRSSLTSIPPGTYVAEVMGSDGKTSHGTYPVTVVAGQTAVVEVH